MKVFSRATVWDLAGIEDLGVKICSNFWVHEHMKHYSDKYAIADKS